MGSLIWLNELAWHWYARELRCAADVCSPDGTVGRANHREPRCQCSLRLRRLPDRARVLYAPGALIDIQRIYILKAGISRRLRVGLGRLGGGKASKPEPSEASVDLDRTPGNSGRHGKI